MSQKQDNKLWLQYTAISILTILIGGGIMSINETAATVIGLIILMAGFIGLAGTWFLWTPFNR